MQCSFVQGEAFWKSSENIFWTSFVLICDKNRTKMAICLDLGNANLEWYSDWSGPTCTKEAEERNEPECPADSSIMRWDVNCVSGLKLFSPGSVLNSFVAQRSEKLWQVSNVREIYNHFARFTGALFCLRETYPKCFNSINDKARSGRHIIWFTGACTTGAIVWKRSV